jgi:hypothetical protein
MGGGPVTHTPEVFKIWAKTKASRELQNPPIHDVWTSGIFRNRGEKIKVEGWVRGNSNRMSSFVKVQILREGQRAYYFWIGLSPTRREQISEIALSL